MQWSRSIVRKEEAEKAVLEFVPTRFDLGTPEQALDYLTEKKRGSDFRISDPIKVQTGLDKLEQIDEEEKIEAAALEKLKEIQEAAYKEAHALGLEEGRQAAFEQYSQEINSKLASLDDMLTKVSTLKQDLVAFNEAHLMRLLFEMASRLAKVQIEANPETIVEVLRSAIGLAQDEENIRVQVSASQFEFLEELKKQTGRDFEFLKKVRFEGNPDIADGGCIVETNYGEVDARVEQRVEQLWQAVKENIPRVKDKIAG